MHGKSSKSGLGALSRGVSGENVVAASMLLVAATIGVALHLHLGLAIGPALALVIVLGAMFTGTHAIMRQAGRTRSMGNEIARLEFEIDRLKGRAYSPEARPHYAQRLSDIASGASRPAAQPPSPPMAPSLAVSTASNSTPGAGKPDDALPRDPGQRSAVAEANDILQGAPAISPSLPASSINDAWSFRPAQPRFEPAAPAPMPRGPQVAATSPDRVTPPAQYGSAPGQMRDEPRSPSTTAVAPDVSQMASLREADVEMIQNLIKKLADEVNAADLLASSSTGAAPPPRPVIGSTTPNPALAAKTAEAIDQSVGALRRIAGSMGFSPRAPEPVPVYAPVPVARGPLLGAPPPPAAHGAVAASPSAQAPAPALSPASPPCVADQEFVAALRAGRIDVLLEPIIGLGDLRPRHFEVSIRLEDATGDMVDAGPRSPHFAGTTLLPLLDRARMERTAGVARRLEQRGKSGSVFSEFSRDSLTDRDFLLGAKECSDAHAGLAGQLVLSFCQNDLRYMSEAHWLALSALRSIGFRFALQDVTDLDMDFERLAHAGFNFAKLDADVFLEGLRAAHGIIPAGDICRHLAGLGLTLIVGRIDDEGERARLFGFGVVFGQGQLFGGARPMKVDAITRTQHAAA